MLPENWRRSGQYFPVALVGLPSVYLAVRKEVLPRALVHPQPTDTYNFIKNIITFI